MATQRTSRAKRKGERLVSHKTILERAVKKALAKYHTLYRLPNWPIFYRSVEALTREWDGAECIAGIDIDYSGNEVCLDYRDNMKLESVDLVIAHELAHWLVYDLDLFLESALGRRQRRHAKELLESIVESIALAVVNPTGRQRLNPRLEEKKDANN